MSSFLEDFLKREVDQNQVNALVGSLENQLTTSRSSPVTIPGSKNVTPGKNAIVSNQLTSHSPDISRGTTNSVKVIPVNNNLRNNNFSSVASTVVNGKSQDIRKTLIVPSNSIINNVNTIKSSSPGLSSGPRPPGGMVQVSIAPKIANTVPIAPRLGSNIMITPRQAQILMAHQRFGANPALLHNTFIARVPGNIPVPRMPGSTIAVPPIMNTQIPGIRTVNQQPGGINMSPRPGGARIRMNSPLSATSLTQIKGTNSLIPGQINYRFRQVNPATSVNNQVNNAAAAQANANNITMMKESVKRLKEFFQNLINLACGPNQPPEIGKMVKELVHNLMQSRVSEEEFIDKLQKTLKSDPQPNLVHFLKKTLPYLRETIKKQQQITSKNNNPPTNQIRQPIQISRNVQAVHPNHAAALAVANMHQRGISPQLLIGNASQQQMMQKQIAQQGRIIIASSGQVTPGMKTTLPSAHHGVAGKIFMKPNAVNSMGVILGGAKDNKPRNSHYSSAIGGDDDINDVTCMAGVNLMEESQKILATGSDLMSYQTKSINDKPFLSMENLKPRIEAIAKKCGMSDVHGDVMKMVSHATEQRLRALVERLSACCVHRNDPHKDEVRYEATSFVRNQLKVFEEIDEVERKHRESREREMLMRVAKSRSRAEDPEQARLKEKAKQMQLEEEEVNRKRAANKTALEAIGGPRKKRKLDEALESLQNASTPNNSSNSSNSNNTNSSTNSQSRSRQRRITLKDLVFVLESEKDTSKSLLLYKSYLR